MFHWKTQLWTQCCLPWGGCLGNFDRVHNFCRTVFGQYWSPWKIASPSPWKKVDRPSSFIITVLYSCQVWDVADFVAVSGVVYDDLKKTRTVSESHHGTRCAWWNCSYWLQTAPVDPACKKQSRLQILWMFIVMLLIYLLGNELHIS